MWKMCKISRKKVEKARVLTRAHGRFLTWHRSVSLEAEPVSNPDPFKELKWFYARTLIYIVHFQKLNFEKF